MSLTQRDLDELLLHSSGSFTIYEPRTDGKTNVFTGKDVTAFVQRMDHGLHSHKVVDAGGQLVYERDINGVVHIGTADQLLVSMRRERLMRGAGKTAVSGAGMVADSFKRALRFWGKGMRR